MPDQHRETDQAEVTAFLGDPATHGGAAVQMVETHAAKIFLAGGDAYKLKRALAYPYLDFTSLAERKRVCEREIELNRRTAPGIYLGCVPVTRAADGTLAIGGAGEVVEWLVHMRRFKPASTLDRVLEDRGLKPVVIDALADDIALMHQGADPAFVGNAADRVACVAEGNLAELGEDRVLFPAGQVATLSARTREALQRNAALLHQRAQAGEVRRCHGDLHLGNIALIDGRPVIFDALEFDEELATTDVLYDLAFLLMDCVQRDARPAASRLLNRWLSRRRKPTDLNALALLPLFLSMRAAVRAKVLAARAGADGEARKAARTYLDAALEMLTPAPPVLLAIGGFSGSGKSTAAQCMAHRLAPDPGAVILRSDQIRKEIAGVGEFDRLPAGAYTQAASDRVYAEIRDRAARALRADHSVIADAVHGTQDERDAIAAVAARAGCLFGAVWLEASRDTLLSRVGARVDDASDATGRVVDLQLESLTAPTDWPRISSSGAVEDVAQQILGAVRERSPGFGDAVR